MRRTLCANTGSFGAIIVRQWPCPPTTSLTCIGPLPAILRNNPGFCSHVPHTGGHGARHVSKHLVGKGLDGVLVHPVPPYRPQGRGMLRNEDARQKPITTKHRDHRRKRIDKWRGAHQFVRSAASRRSMAISTGTTMETIATCPISTPMLKDASAGTTAFGGRPNC